DALIVKKVLKIGPAYYEARQENLHKWNPVGVASLIIASGLGTIAALGYMGTFLQSTAAFFASLLAALLTVILAVLTKRKYYIKVKANAIPREDHVAQSYRPSSTRSYSTTVNYRPTD